MDIKRKHKRMRLEGWDYSSPSLYFVTFCTHDRRCILSKIVNEGTAASSVLTSVGLYCKEALEEVKRVYPEIIVDHYVVMPNHVHALVDFREKEKNNPLTLGKFVGQWKKRVTSIVKDNGMLSILWQPSFYDHIVRDDNDLMRILQYMDENPKKWLVDRFYSEF